MKSKILASSLLLATVLALSSCGGDTADLLDEMQGDVDTLTTTVETLEGQVETLEGDIAALEAEVADQEREMKALAFYQMSEAALANSGYIKGVAVKDNNYHGDMTIFVKFTAVKNASNVVVDGTIADIIYSNKGTLVLTGKSSSSPGVYSTAWESGYVTFFNQFVGKNATVLDDLTVTYDSESSANDSTVTIIAEVSRTSAVATAAIKDAAAKFVATIPA